MKRLIALGAVPVLLAGCVPVLPLPISIVTSGLSGISMLATGKSTTDHVISAANKQDCVMHRVAFGEDVCRDYAVGEYRPATEYTGHFPGDLEQVGPQTPPVDFWADKQDTNTAEPPRPEIKQEPRPERDTVEPLLVSSLARADRMRAGVTMDFRGFEAVSTGADQEEVTWQRPMTPIPVESASLPPFPETRPSEATVVGSLAELRFLSLGSFRSAERANNLVQRFAHLSPTVMTVEVKGVTWQRVAVGPMAKPVVERLRRSHPKVDGRDTWTFTR